MMLYLLTALGSRKKGIYSTEQLAKQAANPKTVWRDRGTYIEGLVPDTTKLYYIDKIILDSGLKDV